MLARGRRGYQTSAKALNYCVELVQERDVERYLCNLSAPAAVRPALFALHAFNLETARVRSSTREPQIARMRFVWWRSTVTAALRGEPPDNPVAQALAGAAAGGGLTGRFFHQMLEAREDDVDTTQPADRAELLRYCERTAGSLLHLSLEASGVAADEPTESAALHVGCAVGIATLLRGAAHHAEQGASYIPADVAQRHGASLKQLLSGRPSAPLCDAAAELAHEATTHLLAARALAPDLSPQARALLQPAVVAELVLQRLQAHGYNVFAPELREPLGLRLRTALAWNAAFRSF
uniref:15-cis-phytoene synthase n=1 Tax=Emiliania huxleyi TaxID=2903 RepID=A0A7S3SHY1_EMIHU